MMNDFVHVDVIQMYFCLDSICYYIVQNFSIYFINRIIPFSYSFHLVFVLRSFQSYHSLILWDNLHKIGIRCSLNIGQRCLCNCLCVLRCVFCSGEDYNNSYCQYSLNFHCFPHRFLCCSSPVYLLDVGLATLLRGSLPDFSIAWLYHLKFLHLQLQVKASQEH